MSHIEDRVCQDIQTRAAIGLTKYGVDMERTDLSQAEWVQHAYEECLDMAVYLKRLQKESCSLSKDDKQFLLGVLSDCQRNNLYHVGNRCEVIDAILSKLKDDLKMV